MGTWTQCNSNNIPKEISKVIKLILEFMSMNTITKILEMMYYNFWFDCSLLYKNTVIESIWIIGTQVNKYVNGRNKNIDQPMHNRLGF